MSSPTSAPPPPSTRTLPQHTEPPALMQLEPPARMYPSAYFMHQEYRTRVQGTLRKVKEVIRAVQVAQDPTFTPREGSPKIEVSSRSGLRTTFSNTPCTVTSHCI